MALVSLGCFFIDMENGLLIPNEILNDKRLSPTEMYILSIYYHYTKEDELHCCYISNAEIADLLHISDKTVIRAKNHLKELGLIIHNGGIKVWYTGQNDTLWVKKKNVDRYRKFFTGIEN